MIKSQLSIKNGGKLKKFINSFVSNERLSIKSNIALAKSPTRTVRTQSNHFFASIYAFFKLEKLKLKHNLNHFALVYKLYYRALKASFAELQRLE